MRETELLRAGVVGHPIGHSLSPTIHGYWLEKYSITGEYRAYDVPKEALGDFLNTLMTRKDRGCNLTIPHKEAAFSLVRVEDPLARGLKSINTVYREGDTLWGLNTDGYGFWAHLKAETPQKEWVGKHAVVLGAGGAARGIIGALAGTGLSHLTLLARDVLKAQKVLQDLTPLFSEEKKMTLEVLPWHRWEEAQKNADLLVNTTPLGMTGFPPLSLALTCLPEGAVVYDIVYAPLETPLLKEAKKQGYMAIDGLGMLLHQAVLGFEKWFGVKPKVTSDLKKCVLQKIKKDKEKK